jgi:hypothetical protein
MAAIISCSESSNISLTKGYVCTSKVDFSVTIIEIFGCRVVFSSAEWFGTEFREFASILVPGN